MPTWQDPITSGIDTHRALPVGVVVGHRMGDGGNDGDIDDVSDSVESWSLAIACVETVLNSQDKPTHENGKENTERYRWESDDNRSTLLEARGSAEVGLDNTTATDARPRDTRAVSDDDAGHSLPLVMACVEAVLGSGDEENDNNGEWSVAIACAEAVLDTSPLSEARGSAEVVLDTTTATDARPRDTRAMSDDDAGHSLPLVMACVEAVLGSGDEGNDNNGEWSVAIACAEAVLDTTDAADARPPCLQGWRWR